MLSNEKGATLWFVFAREQRRSFLLLLAIVTLGCSFCRPVRASSIPFPLNFFTLINTDADGSAVSFDNGLSVVLTGGNVGSGMSGETDLVAIAPGSATIAFQYIYRSDDFPGSDRAGYLINFLFTPLADTDGQSGNAVFTVTAGDLFGFRVETDDNQGEPGIFTVSEFSGTTDAAPEPNGALLVVIALICMAASSLVKRTLSNRGTE